MVASISTAPDLLTPQEAIIYLRLDADGGNSAERLRNLIRRQRLPVLKRGRLRLFRRTAIDAWLDGSKAGTR
jgi:excisionase family DNA binding protein